MAHYALLDENNIVTQVFVGIGEEQDPNAEAMYSELYGQPCKRTSYNTKHGKHYSEETGQWAKSRQFRMNYAGVGYVYDEERDAFIPPKPFDSWILNEDICDWEPPVPIPVEGRWRWDEETTNWVAIEEETS